MSNQEPSLTGVQRAAIVLLSLGEQHANRKSREHEEGAGQVFSAERASACEDVFHGNS